MYTKKRSSLTLSSELEAILTSLQEQGTSPVLVGGCVRDHFLNIPIKDYDIEVFNIKDFQTLSEYLISFGSVNFVGESFGVLKLKTNLDEYDFALPRREIKVSKGHKGFEVISDSSLSFKKASLRRDFTINAIGYDFNTKSFLDPYEGLKDIESKTLRHINDTTFVEDPLRIYRAVQFASRFEFKIDLKTKTLCKEMVENNLLLELAKERIYEEFKKFFLKASKPSIAFENMKELGILKHFPELEVLIGCMQDKEYHPEGDVWIHTLMCLDEMAKLRTGDSKRDMILMFAILCHDFGKPFCTKEIKGRITSHKHEALGVEHTKSFLAKLTNDKKLIDEVLPLVKYHLAPFAFHDQQSSTKAIKRLSLKANIENLCLVALADCKGRDIKDKAKCEVCTSWLLQEAKKLDISTEPIKAVVQGRDLIALGFKPSKKFKEILEFAFDLQIDESLTKEQIIEKIHKTFILN